MHKRILLVLLAVVLVVSLMAFAACAEEDEVVVTDEWQYPDTVLFSTLRTDSPNYGAIVAWTTMWGKDNGVRTRIVCEDNSQVQLRWAREGRFFCTSPHQNRDNLYGAAGWTDRDEGPFLSAVFYPGGVSYWSYTVLGDSEIKTPFDLKPGMKIRMTVRSEAPMMSMYALCGWADIDPEDIIFIPSTGTGEAGRWLIDGKVDVSLCYVMSPFWMEVAASPHGVRVLELDYEKYPEAAERFLYWYPWVGWGQVPETDVFVEARGLKMVKSITSDIIPFDKDPELIYRMVKWKDENYDQYKNSHPWCADMTIDNLLQVGEITYEPIHDGGVRYLEEIGRWTEVLDDRRTDNIRLMLQWVDLFQDCIALADDRGIDVDSENEEWQEFWEDYKDASGLPMLKYYQNPGDVLPTYKEFYDVWNARKPKW